MHYYIHSSLTTNGIGVQKNNVLSITDKMSINKWYPFPTNSTIRTGEILYIIPWLHEKKSQNGLYSLVFDKGILSIIDIKNKKIIWQGGTTISPSNAILENGNLVTKIGQVTKWSTGVERFTGADCYMYLHDDGNLILYHNGIAKWSSKTGKL